MNILGIGLDYLMLQKDKVRGDVRERQFDYARRLASLTLIVYSPRSLNLRPQEWTENLKLYPTGSLNKNTFIFDAFRVATEICRHRRFDAITTEDPFTTGFIGYLLKKKYKIPLNVQVHIDFCDNEYWMNLRKINRIFNILGKFILRRADTIRVGTNYERNKLSRALNIPETKISVIPVNSEVDRFKNVDGNIIRQRYLNGRFNKMLLFTGRLVSQKDIPTLLRAFQIVALSRPKTLLLIVGKGREERCLKKIAVELGLKDNVIFTNSIEHKKIPEYLSACDVYTISSIFEGTCIAMAEAMAAGKPVVATRFAGAQDLIVNGQNGFSVAQKDHETMAEKILYLLDNPDAAKEMGQEGSRRVEENFSNNKNIGRVIEMWEKTAKCR